MKTDFVYFDVIYGTKITYACQHENTAIEWVNSIKTAKEYAKNIDQQIQE